MLFHIFSFKTCCKIICTIQSQRFLIRGKQKEVSTGQKEKLSQNITFVGGTKNILNIFLLLIFCKFSVTTDHSS